MKRFEMPNVWGKSWDMTKVAAQIAETEKEIAWNEKRLENLILDDVNRQLTEDLVSDLRQERQMLLAVLNG